MPHEELATGVIATKEKASELIDNALARIKKRDDAKKPVPSAGPNTTPTRTMVAVNIPPAVLTGSPA